MKEFAGKYADRIQGVLSCFDRMLFRGYLPIMSGWAMAEFLNSLDLKVSSLKVSLDGDASQDVSHIRFRVQSVEFRRLDKVTHCRGAFAAAIYSLIGSAKSNGIDPEAYLSHVLNRIADHPIHSIHELLL